MPLITSVLRKNVITFLAPLVTIGAFLAGPGAAEAQELKVVASFSIIADLAKNVGGERVEITTLVGPDADAHVYEPRPADSVALARADIVLVNGLGFEGFLPRLAEASGTKASIVEVSKGAHLLAGGEHAHEHHAGDGEAAEHATGEEPGAADHSAEEEHGSGEHAHAEEGHGVHDPHAWQSVPNARVYVRNIADAFCAADAQGCNAYRANAAAYDAELAALDAELRAGIASIPADRRVVITSHDAFGYFEREYGLRFLAPEGVSTDSEASAADAAALIRQVREEKAAAIFVESMTDPRLIEQIARETGLRIGGSLFSDALSRPDGPAATYLDMMRHNMETIRGAVIGG